MMRDAWQTQSPISSRKLSVLMSWVMESANGAAPDKSRPAMQFTIGSQLTFERSAACLRRTSLELLVNSRGDAAG